MKEKKKQGGGLGPVVGGEDHLPADSKVQFDDQIKLVYIYMANSNKGEWKGSSLLSCCRYHHMLI